MQYLTRSTWPHSTLREQVRLWVAGCSVPVLLSLGASGALSGAGSAGWWITGSAACVGGLLSGVLLRSRLTLLLTAVLTCVTLYVLGLLNDLNALRPVQEGGDPFADGLIAVIASVMLVPLTLLGTLIGVGIGKHVTR